MKELKEYFETVLRDDAHPIVVREDNVDEVLQEVARCGEILFTGFEVIVNNGC